MVSSTKVFPFGTKSPTFNIDGSVKTPKVTTSNPADGDFTSSVDINYAGAISAFHDSYFLAARGTEDAKVKLQPGDIIKTWHFSGWDGAALTPTFATGVTFEIEVDDTVTDGSVPAGLTIASTNLAAGTSSALQLNSDGSVVIVGSGAATLTRTLDLQFASGINFSTPAAKFTINDVDAFDAISPMTTRGDLISYDGNTKGRIPAAAINNVLLSNGVAMVPIYGKVGLTTHIAGTLPIASGGTGETTQTAAFDALSPNTTKGDIIANNGTNNVRLPAGTNGYVITADSTAAAGVSYKVPSGRIFSKIDDTTVTGTVAETSVLGSIDGTDQLDANSLTIGDTFSMMITGLIRTHITNKTISIRIKIGSTVIASKLALDLENTASLQYFEIELDNITFRTIDAAAQVEAGGQFAYLDTSGSITLNSADISNGSDAVDTSVNNAIDVTVQWATVEADNQFVVKTLSFVKK